VGDIDGRQRRRVRQVALRWRVVCSAAGRQLAGARFGASKLAAYIFEVWRSRRGRVSEQTM
jgi:hypothetical protein